MTITVETLRAVRDKIATPDRWTPFEHCEFPKPSKGACIPCWAERAAEECGQSYSDGWIGIGYALGFNTRAEFRRWENAPGRTHAEVIARLDAAIQRMEAE